MKQHYCFLERFNNYFNRKIIKYETLLDYQNNSKDFFIPEDSQGNMTPFDFNPNDNVMTEIIANDIPFDPDYFLLLDDEQNIVQRWFVLEQKRNRQGQWLYTLRRDVVSDNLDTLETSPIFVEKGMLQEDDPFIVNSEGMNLNQIKKSETILKDLSNSAWIVGYIAKNAGGSDINIQANAEDYNIPSISLENIEDEIGLERGVLSSLVNIDNETSTVGKVSSSFTFHIYLYDNFGGNYPYVGIQTTFNEDFERTSVSYDAQHNQRAVLAGIQADTSIPPIANAFASVVSENKVALKSQIQNILNKPYLISSSQYDALKRYEGRLIKYNGQFYKLNLSETSNQVENVSNVESEDFSSLEDIRTAFIESRSELYETNDKKFFSIASSGKGFYLQLKYVSASDIVPTLDTVISSGRVTTFDQEYDIIAIPLSTSIKSNGQTFETREAYARRIASAIVMKADAKAYDLQLLPYCPLQDIIESEGVLNIDSLAEHDNYDFITKSFSDIKQYTIVKSQITFTRDGDIYKATVTRTLTGVPAGQTPTITDIQFSGSVGVENFISNVSYTQTYDSITITFDYSGPNPTLPVITLFVNVFYYYQDPTKCGIMFYIQDSSFTFTINKQINNLESKKIVSNCYMWRLVSPNYQGAFEFNIAKNGGAVEYFNVFCTLKPYTPFLKVAPNFNYLYGQEFADNRGLICSGDFSLPRISSAWESYELQNKNYQNIFNRDIQHMEFMQSIEMRNQLVSGAVGILADVAKGAGAGGYVGAGAGAIVGGALGAITSGVGYAIDVDTLARTQRENKQLAIDKFNYQLGNIKALPYTLTKVGSFDEISKIYPFVEEYSCSEKELEAFKNKIKYESMTVMRIGTLSEFMNFNGEINYFKGHLIRNDEIADDPHILNAIYEELLKGVYI